MGIFSIRVNMGLRVFISYSFRSSLSVSSFRYLLFIRLFYKLSNLIFFYSLPIQLNQLSIKHTIPQQQQIYQQQMKNMFAERNRQSSGQLKSNHRKYVKKPSPETSAVYIQGGNKSMQEVLQQVVAPQIGNQRYGEKHREYGKVSTSKLSSKEDSLVNYELMGISQSKNFIGDRRKRGKSSFHKKIMDMNNSELFFMQSKVPTTKQVSKASSPSEPELTIQANDHDAEELHYRMVEFQQKCKKAVVH